MSYNLKNGVNTILLNETEWAGYNYLLKQGYTPKQIRKGGHNCPDFICSDGKRFEVKNIKALNFTIGQIAWFLPNDIILIFRSKKLVKKLIWGKLRSREIVVGIRYWR